MASRSKTHFNLPEEVVHRNEPSGPSTAIPAPSSANKAERLQGPKSTVKPAVKHGASSFRLDLLVDDDLGWKPSSTKDTTTVEGKLSIFLQIECPREVLCCQYNEEFDHLASGTSDGVIRLHNSSTGELTCALTDADVKDNRAPVTCIKHRPFTKVSGVTNCFTGTYANGCVKCWNYSFNQCIYTIREKRQTLGIVYHPRFPKFVTFGDDCKVYFYDEESKTQERALMASHDPDVHDGHMSRVFAACFHPRNNYELITGGWDNTVQFWDLRQPYAVRHLAGVHMCGEGIDINSKGTEILTAAYQKKEQLALWDYGSGKRLAVLEPDLYNSKLYCGKFVTNDFAVTGGTDPNLFRVVDLHHYSTAASISGQHSAVTSLDVGRLKPKREHSSTLERMERVKADLTTLPKVAFTTGKRIVQVEF